MRTSIDDLPRWHAGRAVLAILNVLSAPTTSVTYAQIIDGAPINQVVETAPDNCSWVYPVDHPVRTHVNLCPGTLDRAKAICSTFDLKVLKFNPQLIRAFACAKPDSPKFETHLVEMVAVAIHGIAVYLYNLDLDLGNHKDLVAWVPPDNNRVRHMYYPDGKLPTIFVHEQYRDFSQYPHGIADMVGYWAEAQIFGGVVLFDRRGKTSKLNPLPDHDSVFFHSNHKDVTYRVWKLLDTQRDDLMRYLLSEPEITGEVESSPFPILADSRNVTRFDPEEPIQKTGIYRDLWERKPLGDNDGDPRSACTSFNTLDYTCHEDFMRSKERCFARRQEIEDRSLDELDEEIVTEKLENTSKEMNSADFEKS